MFKIQTGKGLAKKPLPFEQNPADLNRSKNYLKWVFFAILAGLAVASYIVWKDGKPDISEERKEKLKFEIEKYDHAEQYKLWAEVDGFYPCLNCAGRDSVFLFVGEIWKYGSTTNGEKGRYSEKYLKKMRLKYQVELVGSLQICLIAEKNKIYQYPLLPENLKRPEKDQLDRPAGNPQDR